MSHALDRLPSQISGGMKQRGHCPGAVHGAQGVAAGRAFRRAHALTRAHLQDEVIRIQSELGNTVMMITHDVDEAVLDVRPRRDDDQRPRGHHRPGDGGAAARPRNRIALAEDPVYNHCRQEIPSFLQ